MSDPHRRPPRLASGLGDAPMLSRYADACAICRADLGHVPDVSWRYMLSDEGMVLAANYCPPLPDDEVELEGGDRGRGKARSECERLARTCISEVAADLRKRLAVG